LVKFKDAIHFVFMGWVASGNNKDFNSITP